MVTLQADGLLEHSRLTCRSLDVAIAVARKPGYFNYYTGTEEVKKVGGDALIGYMRTSYFVRRQTSAPF